MATAEKYIHYFRYRTADMLQEHGCAYGNARDIHFARGISTLNPQNNNAILLKVVKNQKQLV